MTRTHISAVETVNLARKALKEAFPVADFGVRLQYSTLMVSWVDGPTMRDVDAVLLSFIANEAKYISTTRHFSVDFLKRRAESIANNYGCNVVEIKVSEFDGYGYVATGNDVRVDGQWLAMLVMEDARRTCGCYGQGRKVV